MSASDLEDTPSTTTAAAGWAGALIFTALVLLAVPLPAVLAPLVTERWWPGASWSQPFHWWWIPAGSAALMALSLVSPSVEAVAEHLFPRPSQRPFLEAAGAFATIMVLTAGYHLVLTPTTACLATAVAVWALASLIERAVRRRDPARRG